MVTVEFEEVLENLNDPELLRYAIKYLRISYQDIDDPDREEETQEILDCIYMECGRRGKGWIFDKAQEACLKEENIFCTIPEPLDRVI